MREIKVLVTVQVDEQVPSVKVDRETMQDAAWKPWKTPCEMLRTLASHTHGRISFRSALSMPCLTRRKIEGVESNPDSARRSRHNEATKFHSRENHERHERDERNLSRRH